MKHFKSDNQYSIRAHTNNLSVSMIFETVIVCSIPIRKNRFDVIRIDAKVKIIFESVTMTFFNSILSES